MGGLYTEATPETLPLGASPLTINCDYILGSTLQRPGKESSFYFGNDFIQENTQFASTQPGKFTPNEAPWVSPMSATLDTPGTYASVMLNSATLDGLPATGTAGGATTTSSLTINSAISVANGTAMAIFGSGAWGGLGTNNPPPGWSILYQPGTLENIFVKNFPVPGPYSVTVGYTSTNPPWASIAGLVFNFFPVGGVTPPTIILQVHTAGSFVPSLTAGNGSGTVSVGQQLLIVGLVTSYTTGSSGFGSFNTPTDNHGNVYVEISQIQNFHVATGPYDYGQVIGAWLCTNPVVASDYTWTITLNAIDGNPDITLFVINLVIGVGSGQDISQQLQCINYPFSIPPTQQVLGFQLEIYGNQTSSDAASLISAALLKPSADSPTFVGQLPAADGSPLVFGTPTTNWGLALTPALFNNPNFGVYLVAQNLNHVIVTFNVYAVILKVWLTPNPPPSFNYLKTFAETGGELLTLALGSDGVMYQEDAINAPGVLSPAYSQIQPNSFAQSATVDDREFIAISNLQNGTDIPYTYTPPNFARLSQVGPGAPPACNTTSAGSAVTSIIQEPAFSIPTSGFLLQSDSPSDHGNFGTPATPGNVFTIILPNSVLLPTYTLAGQVLPVFEVGGNIVVAGAPTINGNVLNNDPAGTLAPKYYTITSIGQPITGQTYYDAMTFTVNYTTFYGKSGQHAPAGITIQSTIAIMTTAAQVPNLEVGDSFQLTGTGGAPPAGYDSAWQVLSTPNASQLLITTTSLQNNVATYGFLVETGVAPVVGEAVSVTLTLNGNGIFNVANAIITSATAGTFSLSLTAPPGTIINPVAETGSGIVFGTLFTFDAFQIIGNKTGGSITTTGVIAAGQRMVCYSFLTNTGFVTKPSPTLTFDVTAGASAIAVSKLLTGPPNVIARIIHFTAANGGQFYNIEEPVTVTSNGVMTTYSSTIVNDNTSTSVTLSFTDGVLLAGQEIDIQGYNLFENFELGSCVALVPYAQRLFAIGEQNKIFNLLNYSFDGGVEVVGSAGGSTSTYPAGWTVDPTNGTGGAVISSPIFGSAYQILNATGSTQAIWGMITQNAYQDEDQVAIVQPSTTYSVRVTCSVPTAAASGNLVVDLYSKTIGRALGTFTLAFASIGTSMGIYTGTLLTTVLAPVPNDLVVRIYATAMLNGKQIVIDRIEPFPTEAPNLNTQIIGSYQDEFEQFDRVTGVIQCTQENQQAVVTAFTQRGVLYPVKTGSMLSITDNPSTEPSGWNIPRTVSVSVGGTGPYSVTTGIDEPNSGEEWALIGGQAGLFLFQGQQPIKLSEEIQSVWNQINWKYGFTMWVKNDIKNRRILTGVPLNELNSEGQSPSWLPLGVLQNGTNPTTPNAIIEMNYKQLNTAGAVEESVQIHRSYSGKLIASDIVRKWSIWNIVSPCCAFLQRADTTSPTFFGNSQFTGKIYELVDGLMEDDGQPIDQRYFTAGFVPTETAQGMQLGVTRFTYDYMLLLVKGAGTLVITAYPNTLDTPYADHLQPDFQLPASTNGDVELPVNEVGSRMFLGFTNGNLVGSGFTLSRVVLVLSKDPWSPVRGVNN
jgi:hypothetical protein